MELTEIAAKLRKTAVNMEALAAKEGARRCRHLLSSP